MSLWTFDPFNDRNSTLADFFRESQLSNRSKSWLPVVDVKEDDKALYIHAELPGIKKEDIQVDVKDGILTLCGEKKDEKKEESEKYHRIERSYGKFCRSFGLPQGVDPALISASYTDGVLELTVPRPEVKEPERRKIEIK